MSTNIKHRFPAFLFLCLLLPVSCLLFPVSALAAYTYSTDGSEVTDSTTGLIWRRCIEGFAWNGSSCAGTAATYTHEGALSRAKSEATASGKAWRVPNVKELSSIVDSSRSSPAIDPVAFPNTPASWFWTSSPYVGDSYRAWVVYFGNGFVGSGYGRSDGLYVRLVR